MPDLQPPADPLADIDARQDEVLRQLDKLNERLERTLAQFASLIPIPAAREIPAQREAA